MLEAVTGMPAAVFLDLMSLSLSLSSGSGNESELIARLTSRGAGNGAGVPSHGGLYARGSGRTTGWIAMQKKILSTGRERLDSKRHVKKASQKISFEDTPGLTDMPRKILRQIQTYRA